MFHQLTCIKWRVLAVNQITLCLLTCNALAAQQAVTAAAAEPVPIECWWRTSSGAIRVGELFNVVLTCSLMDSPATKAAPDESSLDPNGIQLEPFEVVGGNRSADLPSSDHRFFQYIYRLRLNSADFFAKDVKLPEKKITYRVQRRSGNGPAVEGIEQTYVLPNLSVHVLSLVAADATDIRDTPSVTIVDVDSRLFRSNIFRLMVAVLATSALVLFAFSVTRFLRSRRPSSSLRQLVPDFAVLDTATNELEAIATQRRLHGQSDALRTRL